MAKLELRQIREVTKVLSACNSKPKSVRPWRLHIPRLFTYLLLRLRPAFAVHSMDMECAGKPCSQRDSVKSYERVKGRVDLLLRGEGLRAKAARGGAWLGSGSFAEQVSRFARNIFLARLLAPSAFGAMAIVLSSSSLIASFSDVGVLPAIVQNPRGGDRVYLNAAWWLGMARALFIYVTIFAASPWISRFYGNAESGRIAPGGVAEHPTRWAVKSPSEACPQGDEVWSLGPHQQWRCNLWRYSDNSS